MGSQEKKSKQLDYKTTSTKQERNTVKSSEKMAINPDEVDLVNRDPNNLNGYVQVQFDEVFGEPEGAHSPACVWRNSFACFTGAKNCCYTFLTGLCSILASCCWGLSYGCCAFCMIWCHFPCLKLHNFCFTCIRSYWDSCLSCCVGVLCSNCGFCLSKINYTKSEAKA